MSDPIHLDETTAARLTGLIECSRMLLDTVRQHGMHARLDVHLAPECTSAIITVSAAPDTVRELLVRHHINHSTADHHSDAARTYASYALTLFGHDISVVAYVRHDKPATEADSTAPDALTRQAA